MILETTITLVSGFFGGVINRIKGGMPPRLGKGPMRHLLAIICSFPLVLLIPYEWYWETLIVLIVYLHSLFWWSTGHGDQMDLGRSPLPDKENIAWFLDVFFKSKTSRTRDFTGLTLQGLGTTLFLGIGVGYFYNVWWGIFLALIGANKGISYVIGEIVTEKWKWFQPDIYPVYSKKKWIYDSSEFDTVEELQDYMQKYEGFIKTHFHYYTEVAEFVWGFITVAGIGLFVSTILLNNNVVTEYLTSLF